MDSTHEEVLLRMKMMDKLLDDNLEELHDGVYNLGAYCYTLRMYAEWMMGTVGPSSTTYSKFAKLKDGFLTFEAMLTLDDRDVTNYIRGNIYSQVRQFRRVVGILIESLEEVM